MTDPQSDTNEATLDAQKAALCGELGLEPRLLDDVQLRPVELAPIAAAIRARPGCALLVFGCGNDSPFWEAVNSGGTTVFLEDIPKWEERAIARLKTSAVFLTAYSTRKSDWAELLDQPDRLAMTLVPEVEGRRWDVILIDGPAGFAPHHPGRMQPIFAARRLVAPGGIVFVHDCERPVETAFTSRYLGNERLAVEVTGRALLKGFAF